MKPVKQTTANNCYAACFASILEIPIEDVPCFGRKNFLKQADEWLRAKHDYTLLGFSGDFYCIPAVYHIMCGKSPRGIYHAVVGFQGKMVHDPHPSNDGIEVEDYEFLFPAGEIKGE